MPRVRGTAAVRRGGGEPVPKVWTVAAYLSRTELPGATMFNALLEDLKAIGVTPAEVTERHAIRRINLARQDVAYAKHSRTLKVFGVVWFGFTVGSMYFTTPERKELPAQKKGAVGHEA